MRRQLLYFLRRREKSGDAVLYDFGDTADRGGDHRLCGRHRLENRERQTFPERGERKDIQRCQYQRNVVAKPEEPCVGCNAVIGGKLLQLRTERSVADDDKNGFRNFSSHQHATRRKSSGHFWRESRPTMPTTGRRGSSPNASRALPRSGNCPVSSIPLWIVTIRSEETMPLAMAICRSLSDTDITMSVHHRLINFSSVIRNQRKSGFMKSWKGNP